MGRMALTVLVCVVGLAAASNASAFWGWMSGAAANDFEDSDWEILKATARDSLDNASDGEQVNWRNEATGNKGAMKAIMSFRHGGKDCRRMAFLNVSNKGQRGVANYNLCRQDDGSWGFVADSEVAGK